MTTIVDGVDAFHELVGKELGYSEWQTITQERVNLFADATDDHQWIHVDPERAKDGPFGGAIAHGYLTLSLAPVLLNKVIRVEKTKFGVNYGCNKVRFPSPVPVGRRPAHGRHGGRGRGGRGRRAGHLRPRHRGQGRAQARLRGPGRLPLLPLSHRPPTMAGATADDDRRTRSPLAALPTGDEKTARVRAMFDTIAPRYDLVNRLMTFGLDQVWRRGTVASLALPRGLARPRPGLRDRGPLPAGPASAATAWSGADLSAGMLAANGSVHPAGRGRRQPPALRRRGLRRARVRLRPAQLHRPGRHPGRVRPGAAPRRPAGRARGGRARRPACGAPATTCGSPRPSRPSAARSPTGTPTATCPARWPTCPRRPCLRRMLSTPASPPSASARWPAA